MKIKRKIEEIIADPDIWKDFKLCYIDKIPEEISDWCKESKDYMLRPDFSWEKEHEMYGFGKSPNFRLEYFPNPDVVEGNQYYAYFTEVDLSEQWGDDWDDSPYEHNAGEPYDVTWKGKEKIEHIILVIPFEAGDKWIRLPEDYGFGGNSPWCVKNIDQGLIPWIFYQTKNGGAEMIRAGICPGEFINTLNRIKNDV